MHYKNEPILPEWQIMTSYFFGKLKTFYGKDFYDLAATTTKIFHLPYWFVLSTESLFIIFICWQST